MDPVSLFSILNDGGTVFKFILVFIFLPMVYIKTATDVHKDYATTIKEFLNFRDQIPEKSKKDLFLGSLSEIKSRHFHAFNLGVWLILAITVLLIGIFSLGNISELSEHFRCANTIDESDFCNSHKNLQDIHKKGKETVKILMNLFSITLGLLAIFYISWTKLEIYRKIKESWNDLLE